MGGSVFSTTAIIAVFFALYDAQDLTPLGQSFVGQFGRRPVEPTHVSYAATDQKCSAGVHRLLASSIRPGLIGIGGQLLKYPVSWEQYDHQMYRVSKPQKTGPFLRVLSACNMDGYCVVFDMYGLAKSEGNSVATIPDSLMQLLSENTIVCHAAGNEKGALYNSFGIGREKFKHIIDPQRMWNKQQATKLDTIVMELFGVKMLKEEEQYGPLYWHNDGHLLPKKKITYAAKGAMAALDNYVGIMMQHGNDIHTCELNAGPAPVAPVHTEDSHTQTGMQPFPRLDQPFENTFGRRPVEPKNVFYATTEQECFYGVQRLLSSSIHPGIGIDGEFFNYDCSWEDADHRLRRYRVAEPQSMGPFLRVLSACNMDGYCVVFDMYGLAKSEGHSVATIPESLTFLLSQNTIVCHGASNDILALRNSFGMPRETFNHFIDPQKMWNRPITVGLDTIVKTMFDVELSKEEQGRGLDWHNEGLQLPANKIAYAAKDAMAALDYYMGLKMLNVDDILTDQMGEHSAGSSTSNRRRRPRRRQSGGD